MKQIKRGLEQLYRKVEKHFSDEQGGLLQVIWRSIQTDFTKQLKKFEEYIAVCYPDSGLRVDITIDDLLAYFSEIAKLH